MISTNMSFFWLPLSTMNCNGEPFTHILEWKRNFASSGSFGSSFWIFVVAMMVLGSASIIYFLLSFPLLDSSSEMEHTSNSEAFNSATSDFLARHSLVLWVNLLWNSQHFPMSFLGFMVLFFSFRFGGLSWATPPWLGPLFYVLGVPFPCF
jgi:hypothetical protein